MAARFTTFEELWPHFVRAHSKKSARRLHFAVTSFVVGCAAAGVALRRPSLLVLGALVGAVPAWVSKRAIERTAPAAVPLHWIVRADFLLWLRMLEGTMDDEVAAILSVDETLRAEPVDVRPNMRTDGTLH